MYEVRGGTPQDADCRRQCLGDTRIVSNVVYSQCSIIPGVPGTVSAVLEGAVQYQVQDIVQYQVVRYRTVLYCTAIPYGRPYGLCGTW